MMATSIGLSNCFAKETFIKYCNGENVSDIHSIKEDIEQSLAEVNERLFNTEGMERMHVGYSLKDKGGLVESVALIFTFKPIANGSEKYMLQVLRNSFGKFKTEFETIMYLILDGSSAVIELNSLVKEAQQEHGALVAINYRWNISDKVCSIADWDYDRLKVRMNRSSVLELINIRNEGHLGELISSCNWILSIKEFIKTFNENQFHCKVGAVLDVSDIEKVLTSNMLSIDDLTAVIRKNKNSQGTQTFKTVSIIKELGKFIVICRWVIDYGKKSLSMQIMGDKIFDIENDRFISDRGICNRIEQRLTIPQSILDMIFEYDKN